MLTVTDLFAGAGGSSTGMVSIPGVRVRYAANHWRLACDIHNANHPDTDHAAVDLHQEDPRFFARTDILWASPECTKWSQANGSSLPAIEEGLFEDPLSSDAASRSRLLMFDVLRFAEHHRYSMVIVENVDSILRPQAYCPRCDVTGETVQSWKNGKTVGKYRQQYVYAHPACGTVVEPGWLPASAAIDWSITGERIGDRAKPLADKTRARIAAGIARYWGPLHIEASGNQYDAADPKHPNHGDPDAYDRAWPMDDQIRTLHTRETKALVIPVEGREGKAAQPMTRPMRTQTTRLESAMVVPSGGTWNEDARPVSEPNRTLTSRDSYGVAQLPFVAELRGGSSDARSVTEPAATFTAGGNHHALVSPYYGSSTSAQPIDEPVGTLTTVDRYALIHRNNSGGAEMTTPAFEELRTLTTAGHQSLIQTGPRGGRPSVSPRDLKIANDMVDDIYFRMFRPLEVAAGMAFPGAYLWDVEYTDDKGRTRTPGNRDLVKAMGNAVCPPCSRDLIAVCVEALSGQPVDLGSAA